MLYVFFGRHGRSGLGHVCIVCLARNVDDEIRNSNHPSMLGLCSDLALQPKLADYLVMVALARSGWPIRSRRIQYCVNTGGILRKASYAVQGAMHPILDANATSRPFPAAHSRGEQRGSLPVEVLIPGYPCWTLLVVRFLLEALFWCLY